MIQELSEIVNMVIVELMPEILDLVETAPLGDEISHIYGLIRCAKMIQRILVIGQRVASRIEAKRRSQQARDED